MGWTCWPLAGRVNDFGNAGARTEDVVAGVQEMVKRLRASIPGVWVVMGTLTSSVNSANPGYGGAPVDEKRKAFNEFVRQAKIFDAVVDLKAVLGK